MYPGTALLYKFPVIYLFSVAGIYHRRIETILQNSVKTNKIMAVTIYRDYWSEEVQKIFDERDILVYIYTINDKRKPEDIWRMGRKVSVQMY